MILPIRSDQNSINPRHHWMIRAIGPSKATPFQRQVNQVEILHKFRKFFHSRGQTSLSPTLAREANYIKIPKAAPRNPPTLLNSHQLIPHATPLNILIWAIDAGASPQKSIPHPFPLNRH
ncbi:hypothetical protein ACB098_11G070900 [Castanea mollissima]